MDILKRVFYIKRRDQDLKTSDWLFIAFGLMMFTVITLWTITESSIWFDEAYGAYLIQFNFWDIAKYTAADVHPPLYYWLLKLWSMMFGNTELALRSMSMLFGGVSIVFGYLLAHRLFNKRAARISLIFMVLSPMLVRYSQEMRMYTLVTAIALAATYVLTFAINTKKRLPWLIYGILIALGMWVHYFVAIVWITHWLWRADNIRRVAKKGEFIKLFFSRQWIMAHIVAIVVFLPWLPLFVVQMSVVQIFGFWIPPVTPSTMINFMTGVVYYQDVGRITGWLAFGFLGVIALLSILALRTYKLLNNAERQSYRLIIAISFVPILILFLLSMPPLRPSFIDRYLIASSLGIALFIGVTLVLGSKSLRSMWRNTATIVIAGLMIIGVANVWQMGNYNKNSRAWNGTRQIVEMTVAKLSGNQPIIAASPYLFYEIVFYPTNNHPVYFLDPKEYKYGSLAMLKNSDLHKISDISEFAKNNPIIWYIGYSNTGKLDAPYNNWEPIQQLVVNDFVSGKPAYKAIQYQINN